MRKPDSDKGCTIQKMKNPIISADVKAEELPILLGISTTEGVIEWSMTSPRGDLAEAGRSKLRDLQMHWPPTTVFTPFQTHAIMLRLIVGQYAPKTPKLDRQ